MASELTFQHPQGMAKKSFYAEAELGALAKELRTRVGRSKAEVGRQLEVSRPSMQDAEERPERNLTRLRLRIIEACSPYRVEGPFYRLVRK